MGGAAKHQHDLAIYQHTPGCQSLLGNSSGDDTSGNDTN